LARAMEETGRDDGMARDLSGDVAQRGRSMADSIRTLCVAEMLREQRVR